MYLTTNSEINQNNCYTQLAFYKLYSIIFQSNPPFLTLSCLEEQEIFFVSLLNGNKEHCSNSLLPRVQQ